MAGKVGISPEAQRQLYAARQYIGRGEQVGLGLRIPLDVYFQDPFITASDPRFDFEAGFEVPWEPGLIDGPTSARFVVVDYDGGTETLEAPARWDAKQKVFVDEAGTTLDRDLRDIPQFHQVNVWATLQYGLDFFESGFGLGRPIRWGFEGNRLIVVPHAGYGQNAYYDRDSKSLQFYYFDKKADEATGKPAGRVYTCLSADIINHEFGHAVLDGLRPYYIESISPETAGFHEFVGDLTAILIAFRNNAFRTQLVAATDGNLDGASALSDIADEFGRHVEDRPYLRSALNTKTYDKVRHSLSQHDMSEVLTGAVFDIIRGLCRYYIDVRGRTPRQAFSDTIMRMQGVAIQPLDLLPPVDVTFEDYALAMLRADEIVAPSDPHDHRKMMLDVFIARGLIGEGDRDRLAADKDTFTRIDYDVAHPVEAIASSRAYAYRFLNDNRRSLLIPRHADLVLPEVTTAQKFARDGSRLPRQVLVQYIWREDVTLNGPQFGAFDGEHTEILCGGTLALDENGNILSWARKPGIGAQIGDSQPAKEDLARGEKRREEFLSNLARQIAAGRIRNPVGGDIGLLEKSVAPLTSRSGPGGSLRFQLSPHIGLDDHDDDGEGSSWQISS